MLRRCRLGAPRWSAGTLPLAMAMLAIGCSPDAATATGGGQTMLGGGGTGLPTAGTIPPGGTGGVGPPPAGTGGTTVAGTGATGGTGGIGGMGGMAGASGMGGFFAGDDPNRNMVSAGQVCDRLSTIQCAGEAFCCDNPGRDEATCKTTMMTGCINDLYLDASSLNPVTGFDAAAAATFFTQFETLASTCDPTIAAFGAGATGLLSMFKGTKAQGTSCTGSQTDLMLTAAMLLSCQGDTVACLPGLSWSCVPQGSGSCVTDLNCTADRYCNNPSMELGSCQSKKADGSPCTQGIECSSLFCVAGSCVPADQQVAYCLNMM